MNEKQLGILVFKFKKAYLCKKLIMFIAYLKLGEVECNKLNVQFD